jgi:methylenetetrahydrofolate--tRNA-(uracil-5-)-methyltransferase
VIREEVREIPDNPVIVASGPLTSDGLSLAISKLSGNEHLYFFDAIAPIVTIDSVNLDIAFRGSRYDRGTVEKGDYINCPFKEGEYDAFVSALSDAERIELKEFDRLHEEGGGVKAGAHKYFEGCLPVEVLAKRDRKTLAFGPLRPVGLSDPRSGKRPFAVAQLRQDNLAGTLYNLVGFQTNLKFPEQRRVFRMIPGLENCEFVRYGQMHRNTFIYSPGLLEQTMQFLTRPDLLFAGQITGIEGYAGNIASGLLAGINAVQVMRGNKPITFPKTTMLGALCHYVTHADPADFQPMKANFGIVPPLTNRKKRNKRQRAQAYSERALQDLKRFVETEEAVLV